MVMPVEGYRARHLGVATLEPIKGERERLLCVAAGRIAGGAFIEGHDDVGP